MPVNEDLMRALQKEYGSRKGRSVYYGMEAKGNPSTKPAAIRKSKRHAKSRRIKH